MFAPQPVFSSFSSFVKIKTTECSFKSGLRMGVLGAPPRALILIITYINHGNHGYVKTFIGGTDPGKQTCVTCGQRTKHDTRTSYQSTHYLGPRGRFTILRAGRQIIHKHPCPLPYHLCALLLTRSTNNPAPLSAPRASPFRPLPDNRYRSSPSVVKTRNKF